MMLGILLVIGVLGRRKQRLAMLERTNRPGAIAARPRTAAENGACARRAGPGSDERQAPSVIAVATRYSGTAETGRYSYS